MIRVTLLILVVLVMPAPAQSPAMAVELAARDLARVRQERRASTRYLSMYHVQGEKTLAQWDAVIRFWANSLSRESELTSPRLVAPGLWRVDLDDYRWPVEVWERLAEAEPYFSVRLVQVEAKVVKVRKWWPGGQDSTGRYFAPHWYEVEEKQGGGEKGQNAAAPWTPAKDAVYLREATGSAVPVVRADWWLAQTAISVDRKAGYYDWLGLGKKEADFQALVGADVKRANDLRKEARAVVGRSGVTLNNRGLARVPSLTGAYWFSLDFAKNTEEKNPLRLLDPDIKPDASEQYGNLPNGLWAFWLQNGAGERQDTAPDNIASDGKASGTDRRVHVGLSCARCHVEGIRPINDWMRRVYKPPFSLEDSLDYKRTIELRSRYLGNLERSIKRDQDDYAEVLKGLNGLSPTENAKALAVAWDAYVEADLDAARLATWLGTDEKTLLTALRAEAARLQKAGGKLDPVLAGVVQGVEVRVEHVEEVFALLQDVLARHGERP